MKFKILFFLLVLILIVHCEIIKFDETKDRNYYFLKRVGLYSKEDSPWNLFGGKGDAKTKFSSKKIIFTNSYILIVSLNSDKPTKKSVQIAFFHSSLFKFIGETNKDTHIVKTYYF